MLLSKTINQKKNSKSKREAAKSAFVNLRVQIVSKIISKSTDHTLKKGTNFLKNIILTKI